MAVFGVLIGVRDGFPLHLVSDGREKILSCLSRLGHEVVLPDKDDTYMGGIRDIADVEVYVKTFRENSERLDGLIITLPTFGDEGALSEVVRLSELNVPILIHASKDLPELLGADERGGAYCGKISLCNNLYQNSIPFTNTTKHVCDIDSDVFVSDIERFAAICAVVKSLRKCRLGAIGARPAVFNTLRYSEKLLLKSGIYTVTEDFSMIIGEAENIDQQEIIDEEIGRIFDYADIPKTISSTVIDKIARINIALKEWISKNRIDAAGVLCWNSPEQFFGCTPCLGMAMLTSQGIPCACEMDILSAVSMLVLQRATGGFPICQDWYAEYCENAGVCIHCSSFSKECFKNKPEIGAQFVKARTFGEDRCMGALKGELRTGPITFLKVTTDDKNGKIKAVLGEGKMIDGEVKTYSPYAICQIEHMEKLLDYICKNGFEHHFTLVAGHVKDIIKEALEVYMGWDVFVHE